MSIIILMKEMWSLWQLLSRIGNHMILCLSAILNCSILFAVYSVYGVREMERNITAYTAERKKCVSC